MPKLEIDEPQSIFRADAEPLMQRVRELQSAGSKANLYANRAAQQILCAIKNLERAFEAAR
jgi:hypothetical protein